MAGAYSTGVTLAELLTGASASGRDLSDAEASRTLGALPVQVAATVLGLRGLSGSVGGESFRFPGPDGATALAPARALDLSSLRAPAGLSSWAAAARSAHRAMAPGGRVSLNVWANSESEIQAILRAFREAGFRNVHAEYITDQGFLIPQSHCLCTTNVHIRV